MRLSIPISGVDVDSLRCEIRKEYAAVAANPEKGFHFHTGRAHAESLGYPDDWIDGLPTGAVESFAGTGNPFSNGDIKVGEHVLDVGSGAGFDSLIAGSMVGPTGQVIGVDMTTEMLEKARNAKAEAGLDNVDFREGLFESLPVSDAWADVVISNGVLNLVPDKRTAIGEMARVLKIGGRLQIADILVQKAVPDDAKRKIELWTG